MRALGPPLRLTRSSPRWSTDAQAKVLHSSADINDLRFEPWIPSTNEAAPSAGSVHPLPLLSERQISMGACFQSASEAFGPGGCCVLDPGRRLTGIDITQDAITNCGLVAAMEVMAEHDARRQANVSDRSQHSAKCDLSIQGQNGPIHIVTDAWLPHTAPAQNAGGPSGNSIVQGSCDHLVADVLHQSPFERMPAPDLRRRPIAILRARQRCGGRTAYDERMRQAHSFSRRRRASATRHSTASPHREGMSLYAALLRSSRISTG